MKMPQGGGDGKNRPTGPDVGAVTAVRPKELTVRLGGRDLDVPLPGRLKQGRRETTNPIAVGDRVEVERKGTRLRIRSLLDRTVEVARVDSLRPPRKHILAANVDLAVSVVSAHEPAFNPRVLDRLLLLGEVAGVPGAVCVNKWDLVSDAGQPALEPYEDLGYRLLRTSATTGSGLDDLQTLLEGRVSLLVGHSGVGKSSLINRLVPGTEQTTRPLSEATGRGVHTTTRTDWIDLPSGGVLLDTPGLRHIRPWGLEPRNLVQFFPDLRDRVGDCRFRDCIHDAEPGCAVREGTEGHPRLAERYDSYLRILRSLEGDELW